MLPKGRKGWVWGQCAAVQLYTPGGSPRSLTCAAGAAGQQADITSTRRGSTAAAQGNPQKRKAEVLCTHEHTRARQHTLAPLPQLTDLHAACLVSGATCQRALPVLPPPPPPAAAAPSAPAAPAGGRAAAAAAAGGTALSEAGPPAFQKLQVQGLAMSERHAKDNTEGTGALGAVMVCCCSYYIVTTRAGRFHIYIRHTFHIVPRRVRR
eukprot:1161201-Pelagomonas_calceolata.AAC.19